MDKRVYFNPIGAIVIFQRAGTEVDIVNLFPEQYINHMALRACVSLHTAWKFELPLKVGEAFFEFDGIATYTLTYYNNYREVLTHNEFLDIVRGIEDWCATAA